MLPAVGYDHPDQSHFVSRHFWEVGALDPQLRSGWLGRLLDRIGTPDNPLQGVSMGGSLGPSLATSRVPVAAVDAPEDFGFWMPGAWGPPADLAIPAFAAVGRARKGSRDPAVAQAARAAAFAGSVQACSRRSARTASRRTRRAPPTRRARSASPSASPASPRCSAPACRSAARR